MINRIEAHQNRIKDILLVNPSSLNLEKIDAKLLDTTKKWLLTTSSDGFIKIWSLNTEQVSKLKYIENKLLNFSNFFPKVKSKTNFTNRSKFNMSANLYGSLEIQ